jgi:cytochrome c peroxidase
VLGSTGRLGAALRRAFGAAGSVPLSAPFAARHDGGKGALAPVSAVTFPVLRGEAPEAAEAALGRALFASKLLSRNRSVACASCHDERHAFARPDPPAQTFDRKVPPRNAPGLWNAAYETFFFWDGRASTMSSQIDVAVDRDMGGDWVEVERRLNADEKLRALAGAPLTADRVRRSIVAFERTLIEDQTRLDRHVRGELTLSAPEQRGFDVFFGKARCTRCHRPPLLSSVQPPRFLRTELSAIGAPTRPDGRDLGADTGRHAITHHERDRAMFKAPGLRRVAETAPYFHHGGFATLAQVVSFYEKGGGPGLGMEVPNADPELRPFTLTAAERADLLTFLTQSLGR